MSIIQIKETLTAIRKIDVELDEDTAAEVSAELEEILKGLPFPGYQHVIAFLDSKKINYRIPDVPDYLELDRIDVR